MRMADASAGSTITVILGSNYTKIVPVTIGSATPTPTPTASISSISAAKPGCLS
jgi:hypothetical protein